MKLKLNKNKFFSKGFTLIELLVVIGILGILATALIATIDPFEQLRKASDANVKNALVEYVNGNLRYYNTHQAMPWDAEANGGYTDCGANDGTISGVTLSGVTGEPCLQGLVDDGELKSAFVSATNITSKIIITGTTANMTACYLPTSKSQQRDGEARYAATGVVTTGCTSQNPTTGDPCYWCSIL